MADASTCWFLSGCVADDGQLAQIPVNAFPFRVGRQSGIGLTIPSRSISKLHAELIPAGDGLFVRDLGSTNGTFVNGRRIEEGTPIGDDDLLRFAEIEFRLCHEQPVLSNNSGRTETIDCRLGIISQLDSLLNGQSVIPCYQPIVRLQDESIVGYEALARSDVPGLWSPREMFTAASRLNLAGPLSHTCRNRAVAHAVRLPGAPVLFLNMHPSELLSTVVGQLKDRGCSRQDSPIVLEVHESAVTDVSAMKKFKAELTDLGVGLAYDDFGAGQSRLLDLVRVPPDYLKFDIDLVRNIDTASAAHRAMVRTLVCMVHDLGIIPLAEGIETQQVAEACRDLGFTYAQGYHFGRPSPADYWGLEPARQKSPH